jgi:Fe-S cluster assembly iron-binding protein IscA
MGIYGGWQGQVGILKEASWGAGFGTSDPDTYLEVISEDIKSNIDYIEAPYVFGGVGPRTFYEGSHDVNGSFTMVVNPDNIGLLLYCTLGAEAAASQVGSTTAYDHVFTPAGAGTDLESFAMQIERGGSCSEFSGCTVNSMELSASKGSLVQAVFNIVAKDETDDQTAATLTPSTKTPFNFHHATIELDDSSVTYVNSATLTYTNNIDADSFTMNGTKYRGHAYKMNRMVEGTLECEWDSNSDALRDAYMDAGASKKLELIFTSTETIEAGYYYTLTIEIPKIVILDAYPNISGRTDRTPLSVNFQGIYDSTNFVKVTLRDAQTTQYSA